MSRDLRLDDTGLKRAGGEDLVLAERREFAWPAARDGLGELLSCGRALVIGAAARHGWAGRDQALPVLRGGRRLWERSGGGFEDGFGEFELLAAVGVGVGVEVEAAAGLVETGGADDDELLGLAEALGVDGRAAADHADGGELGDDVGEGHEIGHGTEGLVGEGGVEAGEEDTFAEGDELEGEGDDVRGEELDLIDADDVGGVELGMQEGAELFDRGDRDGLVGVRGVRGDGGAEVAEVDIRLVTGDALAGDAGALEAADQLLGLAGEHGAGDDFEDAGGGLHAGDIVRSRAVDLLAGGRGASGQSCGGGSQVIWEYAGGANSCGGE